MGRTDVRTRVMLYAPPHYKWRGHNNTNDPQKKYSLGTVSNNILLEGLNQFDPHFLCLMGNSNRFCGVFNENV